MSQRAAGVGCVHVAMGGAASSRKKAAARTCVTPGAHAEAAPVSQLRAHALSGVYAFLMSSHPRLGEQCPARQLPMEAFQLVASFLYAPAQRCALCRFEFGAVACCKCERQFCALCVGSVMEPAGRRDSAFRGGSRAMACKGGQAIVCMGKFALRRPDMIQRARPGPSAAAAAGGAPTPSAATPGRNAARRERARRRNEARARGGGGGGS